MEAWVPITIAAAFFQNLRSALQKHLIGRLSTTGATFSRFLYAAPLAVLYVAGLAGLAGKPLPEPNAGFALACAAGGLAQIAATALLLYLFSFRNFAVGTAYSKTETVQTALFGIVILGEAVSLGAAVAILVSLAGVIALSGLRRAEAASAAQAGARANAGIAALLADVAGKPALIGLLSGAGFGIAAVSYRSAALSLGGAGYVMQAAVTLASVLIFQTLLMAGYIAVREPRQLAAVLRCWRVALWVGVSGMLASVGWFTAMTIQNAAYVRALGQIELVFTFAASALVFGERLSLRELAGIGLIVGGIVILLLS